MIRVGINGYGTIGKRVADAIVEQPDMTVEGVAKTRPNYEATAARQRGFALYSAVPERADQFAKAGLEIAGDVDTLVAESDIVVDATPAGIGAENKSLYESHGTPAIFQGGESHDLVDASFNARSNYESVRGEDLARRFHRNF